MIPNKWVRLCIFFMFAHILRCSFAVKAPGERKRGQSKLESTSLSSGGTSKMLENRTNTFWGMSELRGWIELKSFLNRTGAIFSSHFVKPAAFWVFTQLSLSREISHFQMNFSEVFFARIPLESSRNLLRSFEQSLLWLKSRLSPLVTGFGLLSDSNRNRFLALKTT